MSKPVTDSTSGVVYHPWSNDETGAVGFRCVHPDGRTEYIYLQPSSGSDDGVATVFPYQGPHGEPHKDEDACDHHYVIFDDTPLYPDLDIPIPEGASAAGDD